jgi:hypothetical protein
MRTFLRACLKNAGARLCRPRPAAALLNFPAILSQISAITGRMSPAALSTAPCMCPIRTIRQSSSASAPRHRRRGRTQRFKQQPPDTLRRRMHPCRLSHRAAEIRVPKTVCVRRRSSLRVEVVARLFMSRFCFRAANFPGGRSTRFGFHPGARRRGHRRGGGQSRRAVF